jgi:hypothetical protein
MQGAGFVPDRRTMRIELYAISMESELRTFRVCLRAPKKSASEKTAMRRDVVSCTESGEPMLL